MSAVEVKAPGAGPTRTFKRPMGAGWWMRNANYFWYVVREFSALPLALWLLWLLVEIKRAGDGAAQYSAHGSMAFVVFSVVCLLFALYHSATFLSLAGVIIHVKVLDKNIPSRLIVIGAVLIWFAR